MVAATARDAEFEAALEERPEDQGLRLVYADWVEERGDEKYGRALRWLAENGFFPGWFRSDVRERRIWVFGNRGTLEEEWTRAWIKLPQPGAATWHSAILPAEVFRRLAGRSFHRIGSWLEFRSAREATEALAKALSVKRKTKVR